MKIYLNWIFLYIVGDRLKSDVLLANNYDEIKHTALTLYNKLGCEPRVVYRGLLLPPDMMIEEYDITKYDHNSFTDDIEVAKAFSTRDSIYGFIFPRDYVGHIIEQDTKDAEFVWFDHQWAKHLGASVEAFIKHWNQKEIILKC